MPSGIVPKGGVPTWLTVWVMTSVASFILRILAERLLGWKHERLPMQALEVFAFGGVYTWLRSVGDRPKTPPPG